MTNPIPDEAVEAAARVMADDGWTCEYHEPDEGCTVCREAHRHTAIAILTAAAPALTDEQMTTDRALGIVADEIVRTLLSDWQIGTIGSPEWEDYPELSDDDWRQVIEHVGSRMSAYPYDRDGLNAAVEHLKGRTTDDTD